jgi:hypothetical protein
MAQESGRLLGMQLSRELKNIQWRWQAAKKFLLLVHSTFCHAVGGGEIGMWRLASAPF